MVSTSAAETLRYIVAATVSEQRRSISRGAQRSTLRPMIVPENESDCSPGIDANQRKNRNYRAGGRCGPQTTEQTGRRARTHSGFESNTSTDVRLELSSTPSDSIRPRGSGRHAYIHRRAADTCALIYISVRVHACRYSRAEMRREFMVACQNTRS